MVSGEVGRIGGRRCRIICLIGSWGETRSYEIVCMSNLRGRRTLTEAEAEGKMLVIANSEEVKRGEDK